MASGGNRVPAKPAAVAGPGRFATRTDSGTAQVVAPGGSYGSRQQLESQQSAAPVPTGQQAPPVGASQPSVGAEELGVFGPTQRPNESPLAGVRPEAVGSSDVEMMLRAIYQKFPSQYIGRLLNG